MSDLIDLKSPETGSSTKLSKLPSPLIPPPAEDAGSLAANKTLENPRKSLDNNPFDMVIRKTSEYLSKAEDPFELVWQKALTSTTPSQKSTHSRDDCVYFGAKINSKMARCWSSGDLAFKPNSEEKSNRAPSIYIEPPSPASKLEILNQSAMNDSLQIMSPEKKQANSSILDQSAMNDSLSASAHQNLPDKPESFLVKKPINDRVNNLRRSFSQGDKYSPKKSSKTNKSQTGGGGDSNEFIFDDPMNQAFLLSLREGSVSSDISAISRLDSVSSSTAGLCSYNSTANRGFLGSDGYSVGAATKSTDSMCSNISDLVLKFNNLKAKLSGADYSGGSEYFGLNELTGAARPQNLHQQLVDISTDSVFLTNDDVGRNDIFNEAKHLVKTFEELASDSSARSSSDDMLPSQIPNEPMIDIEIPEDNLIELSPTPAASKQSPNKTKTPPAVPPNNMKDLETELLHPEKKLEATTLLMNLEQLVKSENNPEAIKLLENLEKVLGIKCQSNSELLKLCLQEGGKDSGENPDAPAANNEKDSKRLSCEDNINNVDAPKPCTEKSILLSDKSPRTNKLNKPPKKTDEKRSNLNNEKLVLDIKVALDKLLTSVDGEPAKLLENLNKVLNSDGDDQQQDSPQVSVPASPRKSGLPYRSVKSLSHQSIDPFMKKRQLERPLKRQSLLGHSMDTPKRPEPRSRIDSPKRSLIKRISSDPGMASKVLADKKLPEAVMKMRTSMPVMDKAKLRKKPEDIPVIKKGPLKAVMPLGSMQRGSIGKKLPSTPPRLGRKISIASKLVTSTPDKNPSMSVVCVKKSPKKKPVASSTPGPAQARLSKAKIQVPQSPKGNMSWNISPVTPTAPSAPFSGGGGGGTKLPVSKLAGGASPRVGGIGTPSKLERSLNNAATIQSPAVGKLNSRNFGSRHSVSSPLKDSNGPGKVKNLSKLRRHSGSVGLQKENKLN